MAASIVANTHSSAYAPVFLSFRWFWRAVRESIFTTFRLWLLKFPNIRLQFLSCPMILAQEVGLRHKSISTWVPENSLEQNSAYFLVI